MICDPQFEDTRVAVQASNLVCFYTTTVFEAGFKGHLRENYYFGASNVTLSLTLGTAGRLGARLVLIFRGISTFRGIFSCQTLAFVLPFAPFPSQATSLVSMARIRPAAGLDLYHERPGLLGMANSGPDSNSASTGNKPKWPKGAER